MSDPFPSFVKLFLLNNLSGMANLHEIRSFFCLGGHRSWTREAEINGREEDCKAQDDYLTDIYEDLELTYRPPPPFTHSSSHFHHLPFIGLLFCLNSQSVSNKMMRQMFVALIAFMLIASVVDVSATLYTDENPQFVTNELVSMVTSTGAAPTSYISVTLADGGSVDTDYLYVAQSGVIDYADRLASADCKATHLNEYGFGSDGSSFVTFVVPGKEGTSTTSRMHLCVSQSDNDVNPYKAVKVDFGSQIATHAFIPGHGSRFSIPFLTTFMDGSWVDCNCDRHYSNGDFATPNDPVDHLNTPALEPLSSGTSESVNTVVARHANSVGHGSSDDTHIVVTAIVPAGSSGGWYKHKQYFNLEVSGLGDSLTWSTAVTHPKIKISSAGGAKATLTIEGGSCLGSVDVQVSNGQIQATTTIDVADNQDPWWTSELPRHIIASCDDIPPAAILLAADDATTFPEVLYSKEVLKDLTPDFIRSVDTLVASPLDLGAHATMNIRHTWFARDACNNSITHIQNVIVVDEEAPFVSVPDNEDLECDEVYEMNDCTYLVEDK